MFFKGRDMLGTPKKMMTQINFTNATSLPLGSSVGFSISRRGSEIVRFQGLLGSDRSTSAPIPGMTGENTK